MFTQRSSQKNGFFTDLFTSAMANRERSGSILRETSGSLSMTSSKLGSKDALKSLQEEFKKRKDEKKSALDMDVGELFKQEPSWRGQRRKKLLASRFEEADSETAIRVGKGKQELWEASRVGNFERVMELLFRCPTPSSTQSHATRSPCA